MNIYALPGHMVRCSTHTAGYEYHQEIARKHLKLGAEYTVDHTVVGGWHTDVFLVEVPGVAFNSVFFEDVEPQEDEKNQSHPDYIRFHGVRG